ncbi:MAG: hypothetical protein Q4E57_05895 [Eubacteriales bacterium]|nr:hypothetical protein [Eubacteriales bacterium]
MAAKIINGNVLFSKIKRMMEKRPGGRTGYKPVSCRECEYYHPDWAYRTCYFVECPYRRRGYTLRPYGFIMVNGRPAYV